MLYSRLCVCVHQVFKVVDMLESYMDQYTASTQPDLSPPTHVARAMEHVSGMNYILNAWFPEVIVTCVSLLSF